MGQSLEWKAQVLFTTVLMAVLLSSCATSNNAKQTYASESHSSKDEDSLSLLTNLDRAVPNSIMDKIPHHFKKAVNQHTRSWSGKPGPNYWQQESDYRIDVHVMPNKKKLEAQSTIVYYNNSPDTLRQIYLELTQNYQKKGVVRNRPAEITGGLNLHSFSLNGQPLQQVQNGKHTGYHINGTVMVVHPKTPLLPGESVTMKSMYDFNIPRQGVSGRMGYNKDNLLFIGYWYPKVRVYDDVMGWFKDPFLGNAEFYNEFGNYTVHISVPDHWIVAATGTLANASHILRQPIITRLKKAANSDSIIHVVGKNDFGKITKSGKNGHLTWKFTADDVSDFAFSVMKESMWDATRTPVGDIDGDNNMNYTNINTFYRHSAPLWKNAARDAQNAIKFLSTYTGLSYPWPHMSAVEGGGIIGGGMEYPMMTLIGDYRERDPKSLYAVIAHEFAHMWIPMQLASNERRYAWMDEGTTTFNENQAKKTYYPDQPNADLTEFQRYTRVANSDSEGEIMRRSDYHYNSTAYNVASYPKPASVLVTLRALLGKETFTKAYHTFMQRWQFKHPYPWDLFNTFEDISGRDLDWFWRSWYYETWTLDQAVAHVNETKKGTRIVIQDFGQIPMPATVSITLADNKTISRHIDVDKWLHGATSVILRVDSGSTVEEVVIDPEHKFPDVNRSNNVWERNN